MAEQLLREARIVYIEPPFLEHLVASATKTLGRRGLVARKIGYRTPSRLNIILTGRVGMAFSKFLTLCELSGIPLAEATPNIYAIAHYGNKPKIPFKKTKKPEQTDT